MAVKTPQEEEIIGKAGDVLVYPAGCPHHEKSDEADPVETIYHVFTGSMGNKIYSIYDRDWRIRLLSQWLSHSRRSAYEGAPALFAAYFNAIIEELARLRALPQQKNMVDTVRAYLIEHVDKNISLDDLARQVNMSKYHFLREYKKLCGNTPMADVRSLRLEEAKNLLCTTSLPLKSIAPRVGFADEFHLSAAFKRYTGYAPGKLRTRAKAR